MRTSRSGVYLLAFIAYIPAFLIQNGKVFTDTKLYLATDPGGLLRNASTAWDSRLFAGYVPHQNIGYLWPSGPFFWATNACGIPLWVAQRIWIGSLFFLAAWGVYRCCLKLRISGTSAAIASLTYMLTPFTLSYITRSSVLLLPWVGLGHIVATTLNVRDRQPGARKIEAWVLPATIALIVFSIGGINATALIMIAPAPLIVIVSLMRWRQIAFRTASGFVARTTVLCAVSSAWWLSAVAVQARYGSRVLAFSETLDAVSHTATSAEVLRGMGHWLNYINAHTAIATTSAVQYASDHLLMFSGFAIALVSLAGAVYSRSRYGQMALAMVLAGLVLSIGVHPINDSSPMFRPMAERSESFLALALRSSTRAVPMMLLGLSLSFAIGLDKLRRHTRLHDLTAVGFSLLILFNFAPLRSGGLFDPQMQREPDLPDYMHSAATFLNQQNHNGRVLVVPGSEFGIFDWGYTMDPPQLGLLDQPILTRDLLPLGGSGAMDLFFALDDRLQTGNATPQMIAGAARMLGVSDIWLALDHDSGQYNTVRASELEHLLTNAPGITEEFRDVGVVLYRVEDSPGLASVRDTTVLLDGSGDGIVDATGGGILSGNEALLYASSFSDSELKRLIGDMDAFVVTDTNRAEARQWSGSRDTRGATEARDGTRIVTTDPPNDERFDLFKDGSIAPASQSLVNFIGPVRATASGYGSGLKYQPEFRPSRAIDGDKSTAWRVGDQMNPVGEFISVRSDSQFRSVRLVQPLGATEYRWITRVAVDTGSGQPMIVDLNEESRTANGQIIVFNQPTNSATVSIEGVDWIRQRYINNLNGVGFAEIDTGLGATTETIIVPARITNAITDISRLVFNFERQRTRPTDTWRKDPETSLDRTFELPARISSSFEVKGRFDARLGDTALTKIFDLTTTATDHLVGDPWSAGWAATDGDRSTSWKTPIGNVGATLRIRADSSGTTLRVSTDKSLARVDQISVTVNEKRVVSTVGVDGTADVRINFAQGDLIEIKGSMVALSTVPDPRTGRLLRENYGISEVTGEGITKRSPGNIDIQCDTSLLAIDGTPIGLTVKAVFPDYLDDRSINFAPCGVANLSEGTHRLVSTSSSGLLIDTVNIGRLNLDPHFDPVGISDSGSHRTIAPFSCPNDCTLIFAESFNEKWSTSSSIGRHIEVDGGFNGWRVNAGSYPEVRLSFTPQKVINLGLSITLFGIILCVLVLLVHGRGSTSPLREPSATRGVKYLWQGSALVIGALLVVGPRYAVYSVLIVGIFTIPQLAARRFLISPAAWSWLACQLGLLTLRYIRNDPRPGSDWPMQAETFHRGILFAVIVIAWGTAVGSATNAKRAGILARGGAAND